VVCKLLVKILVLGIATESKLRNPLQWPKKVQKVLAAPVRQIPSCEKAVKSILSKDKELGNTSLTIDIDVTKNDVTLSGTVDSESGREVHKRYLIAPPSKKPKTASRCSFWPSAAKATCFSRSSVKSFPRSSLQFCPLFSRGGRPPLASLGHSVGSLAP